MKKFLALLVITFCFISASVAQQNEDFNTFYEKFHKDTLFQDTRITKSVPLSNGNFHNKQKANEMSDSEFIVETKRTATEYTEKIYIQDSGFLIELKFKVINGKWFLVYYLDYTEDSN